MTVGPVNANLWLDQTFFHFNTNQTGEEMARTLGRSDLPSLHWITGSQKLCFHSSNWRIDGVGMLMLANRYLTFLATAIRLGLDTSLEQLLKHASFAPGSLPPSLDHILNSHMEESTTAANVQKGADSIIGTYQKGVPSIGLPIPSSRAKIPPMSTYRSVASSDTTTATKVIDACKEMAGALVVPFRLQFDEPRYLVNNIHWQPAMRHILRQISDHSSLHHGTPRSVPLAYIPPPSLFSSKISPTVPCPLVR
ncbi:hypothetical protein NQ176_g984 [Zarea fungicola]|uniref:Uncharacterized protein n=1 Tax=Zarea fungicola TaxID=93591 RepID=A0ACC1NVY3_9HYPO|nr:hypothetical protein NQ176_g984 [Lecanicillium fungicola]